MKINLNKIDWLRVGLHTGWIKSADLNEEDQNLMDQISKAEPYVGEKPSEWSINGAITTFKMSMDVLKEMVEDVLKRLKSNGLGTSTDYIILFWTLKKVSGVFDKVMGSHGNSPIRLAKSLQDLSPAVLYLLDTLEEIYNKYKTQRGSTDLGFRVAHYEAAIKFIRKDLIRTRKILERAV
jgi:hypothetical protein